ncbi:MAG: 4-(cytidine 5'-diphospho)-2-C-methyl-D-erythritol kinase [Actinobacteria bacterium]|nr:4-(cytidine 5'-diphospho)-2-C-methyl-D-erythritol kinase [Actinomycetota bacterium]MCB9412156.1 4-(cytidine 5'-diphospho)-2-C-methyl-D-erythritol kinase [Actinomycetota bacterium]
MPQFAKSVTATVPAKVNLALGVGPLRADGYHELATVYQAVGLYDEITVSRRSAGSGITISAAGPDAESVPIDRTNLAWQAAELVSSQADAEPDVHIHIDKRIPIAGGMAGGSADAAGALLACDVLWRASLPREQMAELASELGSDIPFLLYGGTAIGTGRGENITSAMARGSYHWVFAVSDRGLPTPKVYAECDRLRTGSQVGEPTVPPSLMEALLAGDPIRVGESLVNDLQPAAISLRPELDLVLEIGNDAGALGSLVSGSGPTCAFLVADEEAALDLAVSLSASGLCSGVERATGPVGGAKLKES